MRKNKHIYITKRDLKIFKYLFINKVASTQDVKLDIFQNTSFSALHRRIKKLSKRNLIEARLQKGSRNLIYNLSEKAFKMYLSDMGELHYTQLKSDAQEHDLDLLQIKRRLKMSSHIKEYYSENLIKSGFLDDVKEIKRIKNLRPDAILKIKYGDDTVYLPLEYESSSKSSKRNQILINKYYTHPYRPDVLFISKTPQVESKIKTKEYTQNATNEFQFFYTQKNDLLQSKKEIHFANLENERITLN